jgi:hypothetical protein
VSHTISVIASGWSLATIDRTAIPGYRIGVNDSLWRIPCHAGVTMDRLFLEGRAGEIGRQIALGQSFYYRHGTDKKEIMPEDAIAFDNDHTSIELSKEWSPRCRLNGTNSGVCAINLAYRMQPERVLLWGFDMCRSPQGDPYYHEPYPWARAQGATSDAKYQDWSKQFARIYAQYAAAGIELVNCSRESKITSIPKVDPLQVLI